METKRETILQTRKTLHLVRDMENEKLYHLVNNTFQELYHLSDGHINNTAIINSLKEKFNEVHNRLLSLIKKETNFILPYIDKVLDKVSEKASDTFIVYSNLTIPLKMHIIEQSKIMDKLEELKGICFSTTADNYCGKILLSLIEICQLFERHIFIEQRVLIPAVIQLVEIKPQNNTKINLQTYANV
ncbi:MAG TPA: hypothetical protein VNX01_10680 [Bacteroidia bacterium]|jgi:hypothetical protein|nr:hypothetical protein [Bacteroidia bacterium]